MSAGRLLRAHGISLAGAVLVVDCTRTAPARDQWLVYLGTDAPIPQLGEQVLVEVLDGADHLASPDARHFVDASQPRLWPISFGVVPEDATARPRLRIRLYRLEETGSDGLPSGDSLIDATVVLPPADGLTPVGLTLAMNCFSVAADLASHRSCDPATGGLAPEPTLTAGLDPRSLAAPGSWPPAASVPCAALPPEGMVCIPGGLFLLGSARYAPLAGTEYEPVPQRLVQLHPFAIDGAEVTVGTVRDLVRRQGLAPPETNEADCTFLGPDDPTNDKMPANCAPWTTADEACRLQGKRLPTEAEWEYVARNLTDESVYPWGLDESGYRFRSSDSPICFHANVARSSMTSGDANECIERSSPAPPPGPVAVGSAFDMSPYDTTKLHVVNLGGNVSEWVADVFDPYNGPCWSGPSLRVDPRCDHGSSGQRSVRGGRWDYLAAFAASAQRAADSPDVATSSRGFRCAKSM